MQILDVDKLKLGFLNQVVIREATFQVDEGDFVAVVGANGSGKSTLIKGILGLIRPLRGKVKFLNGYSRSDIGYLPQEMHLSRTFPATVLEVVLTGTLPKMRTRICYGDLEKRQTQAILNELGILKLKDRSFTDLSGGQKQKVLLARALVSSPRLLILDEPSNNLDQSSENSFYDLLKNLNKDHGTTIMMITHDIDAGDLIGNKVLSIENGEVTMQKTHEYLKRYRNA